MIEIIKGILRFISAVVFVFSLGIIFKFLVIDPYVSDKTVDEVRQIYYSSDDESENKERSNEDKFSKLVELNPDICGWISVPSTKIDYPVLQAGKDDPEFYLSHDYKREKTKYGSIFADAVSEVKLNPKNTILYGHHMADGQMFADLMKFSDLDFYRQNPLFIYNTVFENAKWKIISVFKTNTLPEQGKVFQYVVSKFNADDDFMNYVREVKKRSLIETGIDVNKSDRLLTLSTCSYEFDGFRTVVVARKVREGESDFVDTSVSSKASSPLMPDCWYKKYGGSKPS